VLPAGRAPTCVPRSLVGSRWPARACRLTRRSVLVQVPDPGRRPGHIRRQRSEGKWPIQPVRLIPTPALRCRDSPAGTVLARYHRGAFDIMGPAPAAEPVSTRASGGTSPASARTRRARSSAGPRRPVTFRVSVSAITQSRQGVSPMTQWPQSIIVPAPYVFGELDRHTLRAPSDISRSTGTGRGHSGIDGARSGRDLRAWAGPDGWRLASVGCPAARCCPLCLVMPKLLVGTFRASIMIAKTFILQGVVNLSRSWNYPARRR
jgi:hypothetical protein